MISQKEKKNNNPSTTINRGRKLAVRKVNSPMLPNYPFTSTTNSKVSSPASSQLASSKFKPRINSIQGVEFSRRIVLPLLISVAAVPDASESQKALLQEYLKRSKENKTKNDKERLDSYYKRNYQDYFGFIEGSVKDKDKDQLTESEKDILEWLRKNKE